MGDRTPPIIADQLWHELRRALDDGHAEAVTVHLERLYLLCTPTQVAEVVERFLEYLRA